MAVSQKVQKRADRIRERTNFSERESQMLILKRDKGLSIKEISDRMDVGYESAKTYYRRIKADIEKANNTLEEAEEAGWIQDGEFNQEKEQPHL